MAGIPTSLAIAIWATGACWIVVVVAHLLDTDNSLVGPVVVVGGLTGMAEWLLRRQK